MKAIVLAAGKGERLRSVVRDVPKPMVPVNGKPILEQNIEWLRDAGVKELYINLHHLPEVIRSYFGDGGLWGVTIQYSYEEQLLGTGGAVRRISTDYWSVNDDSSFLVVYGDNLLTDIDLQAIITCHQSKKGVGTIGFHYREDVSQSGIAILDMDQRIERFIEKPGPAEEISCWVNAGVYVLEPAILRFIPAGTVDFGRDVFPAVLREGESLYGVCQKWKLTAIDTPDMFQQVLGQGDTR